MIKDNMANAATYESVSPLIKRAFDFIRAGGLDGLAEGRHDIQGDALYVNVQENTLKAWADGVWEAHRNYADIQYVIEGRQVIGYMPAALMQSQDGYIPERDIEFFGGLEGARIDMRTGDYAIFFPQDAHRPNTLPEGVKLGTTVKMAVFKVRVK